VCRGSKQLLINKLKPARNGCSPLLVEHTQRLWSSVSAVLRCQGDREPKASIAAKVCLFAFYYFQYPVMAERKIDNSLYSFLLGAVSNLLPLEFAIRASESHYPEALVKLKDADQRIRNCLLSWGAKEEEIDAEELVDYAWDLLQIGDPRVRRHGRLFRPEIAEIFNRCTKEINLQGILKEGDVDFPPAKHFRICDLLRGNDIKELLVTSDAYLRVARNYKKKDDVEFSKFAPIRAVREPIYLHPSVEIVGDGSEIGERRLWLSVKIDSAFSLLDIERQMDEFLYQLALVREHHAHPRTDFFSSSFINKSLKKIVAGEMSEDGVKRIDGVAAALAGLYCWDLHKRNGFKLDDAKVVTCEIYAASEDAVERNYKKVNAKIKKYIEKFESGVMADEE